MPNEIWNSEFGPDGQLDMFPETRLLTLAEVPEWTASVGHPLNIEEAHRRAQEGAPGFLTIRDRHYLDREKFLACPKR